jgi:hypothetical protein
MARIFATTVTFDEIPPGIYTIDSIEHQGRLWLVGGWLEDRAAGFRIPQRLVCPLKMGFQPNPQPGPGRVDYSISAPVSKAAYEGRVPPELAADYVVLEQPDVRFPLPPTLGSLH